jgi:CheY-like chemotaxis protein
MVATSHIAADSRSTDFEPDPNATRVLVADSSDERRKTTLRALKEVDPNLVLLEAADGPAALAIMTEHPLDLVLVDRGLPAMDGAAFLRSMEAREGKTVFILLSDSLTPQWHAVAMQIRAYDVLLKPFGRQHARRVLSAYRRIRNQARILLIDDSDAVRGLIRRMLGQTRFMLRIDEGRTAREAISLLKSNPYDVAFVDLSLPDGGGLAGASQIAAVSGRAKIVIMGTAPEETVGSALRSIGAAGYLLKPFQSHDLENKLHEAFGLWRPYLLNARLTA